MQYAFLRGSPLRATQRVPAMVVCGPKPNQAGPGGQERPQRPSRGRGGGAAVFEGLRGDYYCILGDSSDHDYLITSKFFKTICELLEIE